MGLGTVAYNGKIYDLDYMTSEEIHILLNKIEQEKKESFDNAKMILKKLENIGGK